MGSKNKRKRDGGEAKGSDEANQMIKDPRFSSAHTDPRFRTVPRRQTKVAIDSRFQSVLADKASAPVDKRGKRMRKGRGKDSLKEFYRIDEDEEEKKKEKMQEKDNEESSEDEKEIMDEGKSEESEEEESKSEKKLGLKLDEESESDEEAESGEEDSEEEEDTDEDDEAIYEDDGPEIPEEKIATIEKETHRLAIVGMDWRHVSAKDLYALLNSLLPKDGSLLSVAVYPSDFGLQRMKEEEIHGPAIEGRKKKEDGVDDEDEDEESSEEEDEDVINEKLRDYEKSRLRYYYGVAVCDSSATADYLYTSCDGMEFERSSNKLDLRFIPDSMEFVHPPRDTATEAPANYVGLDFHSRALQMSNVNLSWDEDEPHRVKTLNQKFKPDQLAELELKEYLASDDESESVSEEDDNEGVDRSKAEKRKEKYRALFETEGVDSDKDGEEENDQDMEVTFNTGLEDLSRKQLEKKEKKSETVWESVQRRVREKKKAKKNKQNDDDDDSSSPDDDSEGVRDDGDDDFFMKQPSLKKESKKNRKKKDKEEDVAAAEERSKAELELLLADENANDGNALKGYNIKRKGKKHSKEIAEEKIPAATLDDPRFSALFSDPHFALDPTDPNFKRSATYVRQVAQKQKKDPKRHEEVTAAEETEAEPELKPDGKKERHEMNSVIKSVQMKIKGSEMKNAGNAAAASSAMAQRVKKKAKAYSNK
ncbi:unnamed protein product [Microthlaspi erraticum]|uniref:Uncharacterized protein n=1 Tax=Microthlaspi erraticum TaxID=1685480 RepID=A0A6D2JHU6_9BRAS|nr:unnamed protein product [Microthlaspi erraticum]